MTIKQLCINHVLYTKWFVYEISQGQTSQQFDDLETIVSLGSFWQEQRQERKHAAMFSMSDSANSNSINFSGSE